MNMNKNYQNLLLISTLMSVIVGAVTVWHIYKTHKEIDETKKACIGIFTDWKCNFYQMIAIIFPIIKENMPQTRTQ